MNPSSNVSRPTTRHSQNKSSGNWRALHEQTEKGKQYRDDSFGANERAGTSPEGKAGQRVGNQSPFDPSSVTDAGAFFGVSQNPYTNKQQTSNAGLRSESPTLAAFAQSNQAMPRADSLMRGSSPGFKSYGRRASKEK